ncbi:MAG: tRNA (guanine(10)-N(2))-dimethyltransferase [Euryarchaeota archaeon]|nr:tRNA (guanine(10)-N(2))-dimethyltransferase [Euryarchaeota archaeon]
MIVKEGVIRVEVPEFQKVTARNRVFYNPAMELDRDISSLLLSLFDGTVLDGLSATGIRGIRYAKESALDPIFNDLNPEAVILIKKNCKMNGVSGEVHNKDFNLLDLKADIVDIDPFGSPVRYLASAFRILRPQGILCVTATDTQALCVSKKACIRKYAALPIRTDFFKELGLRILISCIVREAMKQDYALDVLLAYAHKHYMRVFLSAKKSLRKMNSNIEDMQIVYYCSCGYRKHSKEMMEQCPRCGKKLRFSLPVWVGEIKDDTLLDKLMRKEVNAKAETILNIIKKEIHAPFYFDLHKLAKKHKFTLKKTDTVINELRELGFRASRTHFSSTGVKTDADISSLLPIFNIQQKGE